MLNGEICYDLIYTKSEIDGTPILLNSEETLGEYEINGSGLPVYQNFCFVQEEIRQYERCISPVS